MRRTLLVLSLALATMTMLANDASAQSRGGRGGSYSGRGYGGGGYGYGRGYGYGGIGIGVGVWPGYYYSNPGYYAAPSNYYYSNPVVQVPPAEIRQSFYSEPAASNQTVTVTVLVPTADAQVWFNGAATTQQGMQRVFSSPPLDQGFSYTYTIKGRWMENGRAVDRERQVNVQSGQSITVDLRNNTGERIALPKTTQD
jgi:uncharacterized protein (TIGR03000 family)